MHKDTGVSACIVLSKCILRKRLIRIQLTDNRHVCSAGDRVNMVSAALALHLIPKLNTPHKY